MTSRSVFPLPLSAVLPYLDNFLHQQTHTRTLYSTPVSEMFFTFLREKLFEKNFSRWMSVKQLVKRGRCKLPAPIKGWNFGAKFAHLCGFWLDISVFSHMKKHRARFWLDTTFFSRVKKHRSLIWLAGTHLRMKIYDIAFWCVFLSMYICLDLQKHGYRNLSYIPSDWVL